MFDWLFLVSVVKCDGDGGLRDSRLAVLVDELLEVGGPHVAQVGDAKEEADRIQDVTLARPEEISELSKYQLWSGIHLNLPIQPSDSIELVIKSINFCSLSVGLEPVNNHWLHKHGLYSKTICKSQI